VYQLNVELLACAYRFRAGHRVRIVISAADFLNVWPTPEPCTNTIYRTVGMPSHVALPAVPPRVAPLPPPSLSLTHDSMPERQDLEAPEYSITSDIVRRTAMMRYKASYGPSWSNSASYTVSADQPARAVIEARATRGLHAAGRDIVVDTQCVTSTDERAFHHTVEVEIRINGRHHFGKSWAVSVPRRLM
jgi:hypothetical protein